MVAKVTGFELASIFVLCTLMPHETNAEENTLFQFQFLYEQCKLQTDFCVGYVSGVGHMMTLIGAAHRSEYSMCPGKTIPSAAAMIQAVLNFGEKHPEMWNQEMIIPAGLALRETWPCPSN